MLTQQSQIKINLSIELKEFLESKATKFGMPIAGYVKHLILKDVADLDYPIFTASEKIEKAYKQAKKEEKEGKLTNVEDIDDFFDSLKHD